MTEPLSRALTLLPVALALAACSGEETDGGDGTGGDTADHAAEFEWEALHALHDATHGLADRTAEASDEELLTLAETVVNAMQPVVDDAPPAGCPNADRVLLLQSDLESLQTAFGRYDGSDPQALRTILAAVEPVVEELMTASGLAHDHDHDH